MSYRKRDAGYGRVRTPGGYRFAPADGSAFAPTSLPGLTAWLDASDASTITPASGSVSEWRDKSGNVRHATQATAANQPTTGSTTMNGKNVIAFDGSDVLLTTVPIVAANCTIIMALSWTGSRNSFYGGDAESNDTVAQYQTLTADPTFTYEPYAGVNSRATLGATSAGAIVTALHGPGEFYRKDGAAVTKTGGPAGTTAGRSLQTWGKLNRAGVWLTGFIAEAIVCDGELTLADIQATEAYLAAKWGVTLA